MSNGLLFEDRVSLIVVYKDEMLLNQFKKLVDGLNVDIVSWAEKTWLANKKAGNITSKVLYLGNLKSIKYLIPVLDIKFNMYGVKFGVSGSQAALFTNAKEINTYDKYLEFWTALQEIAIPDIIKFSIKPKTFNSVSDNEEDCASSEFDEDGNEFTVQENNIRAKLVHIRTNIAKRAEDALRNKSKLNRQMLFFGVVELSKHYISDFLEL